MSWKIKVTGNCFGERHTDRKFAVEYFLGFQLAFHSSSESRTVTDGLTVLSVTCWNHFCLAMLAVVHCSYNISDQADTRHYMMDLSPLLHIKLTSWDVLFLCDLLQTEWLRRDLILGFFFVLLKIWYLRSACLEGYYHTCVGRITYDPLWSLKAQRSLFLSRFTAATFHFPNIMPTYSRVLQPESSYWLAIAVALDLSTEYIWMIVLQSGLKTENSIHHSESLQMGVLASKENANAISRICHW